MTDIVIESRVVRRSPRPRLTNYRTDLAEHPICRGIWRTDELYWSLAPSGRVASIANLKAGGPRLFQDVAGNQGFPEDDPELGRKVLRFDDAQQTFYQVEGTRDPALPWTVVVVCRPVFTPDPRVVAGYYAGGTNTSCLFVGSPTANPNSFLVIVGNQSLYVPGRAKGLNRVIGGSGSGAAKLGMLQVNDGLKQNANGGAQVQPTENVFRISHPGGAYLGTILQIEVYDAELWLPEYRTLYDLSRRLSAERFAGLL